MNIFMSLFFKECKVVRGGGGGKRVCDEGKMYLGASVADEWCLKSLESLGVAAHNECFTTSQCTSLHPRGWSRCFRHKRRTKRSKPQQNKTRDGMQLFSSSTSSSPRRLKIYTFIFTALFLSAAVVEIEKLGLT